MKSQRRAAWMLVFGAAAAAGWGCAAGSGDPMAGGGSTRARADSGMGGAPLAVRAGEYGAAFDASRDVLRDLGFILDRVDAQQGVITTQPKGTGGIATPWDQEQSGIGDRLEDAVQKHQRVVRIEFRAENGQVAGAAAPPGDGFRDLRSEAGAMEARIGVTVYRVHQPGWRLNPQAVLGSSYTHDPMLDERGMGTYSVPFRQDEELARRIVERVRERLAGR